jgi:hypothetical protein
LRNNGSCTWNSSYALVFDRGDSMGGPASAQLTTGTVAPGQLIDVSVTLKAPSTAGTYQGYWKLRNGAGVIFGIGADAGSPFWVKIKSINPITPTPSANVAFNFLSKASSAEWHNATTILPWGDPGEDSPGVAASLDSKLEDSKTYIDFGDYRSASKMASSASSPTTRFRTVTTCALGWVSGQIAPMVKSGSLSSTAKVPMRPRWENG